MAPNAHGACNVCITLDWECVCSPVVKRRRERSESSDSGEYDDVVVTAMEVSSAYGVLWE